jgi:hypothetical protein
MSQGLCRPPTETFRKTIFLPGSPQKFNNFWQLRERNSTHDNNLEGRVKRNNGPFQPRGKFRLFPSPEEKKLPRIMQKSFPAKARTRKNFCRSLDLFVLGVLGVECFGLPLPYGAPSMARAGQMSAQVPQSVQRAGSMLGCFSPAEMASRGHTARQSPQLVHFSVI